MHRDLCGCVHEIAQACRCIWNRFNLKELWLTVSHYLCIYVLYILNIYIYIFPVLYILNSLVLTVKMVNNSHGDYKNTASRVEWKLHENTLLIMLMWEEKNEAGCVGTPPACARTYTHPNTDLNAHIWKYQYIFFRHPTLYIKTKRYP